MVGIPFGSWGLALNEPQGGVSCLRDICRRNWPLTRDEEMWSSCRVLCTVAWCGVRSTLRLSVFEMLFLETLCVGLLCIRRPS